MLTAFQATTSGLAIVGLSTPQYTREWPHGYSLGLRGLFSEKEEGMLSLVRYNLFQQH